MSAIRGKPCGDLPLQVKMPPPSHRPVARALVDQKRPQQRLAIQPVRLGRPPAPGGRNRFVIDHVALNAFLLQNPVQPEPVKPRLLNPDDRIGLTGSGRRLALEFRKQFHQLSRLAPVTLSLDIFSPFPGEGDVTSHVERLSSKTQKLRQTAS